MDTNNSNSFYEDYKNKLTLLIYEKSSGEIPEGMCYKLAKSAINRVKYDISQGIFKDIEEYADAYVWAYFQ